MLDFDLAFPGGGAIARVVLRWVVLLCGLGGGVLVGTSGIPVSSGLSSVLCAESSSFLCFPGVGASVVGFVGGLVCFISSH